MDKELDRLLAAADFARNTAHRDALRLRLFGPDHQEDQRRKPEKREEPAGAAGDGELDEDELELVAAARKDPEGFPKRPQS